MTPQTVWIGGRHPCDPGKDLPTPVRTTDFRSKILNLLAEHPGMTAIEVSKFFPYVNPKTVGSNLIRLEQAGRVHSRRCLESIEGAPGKYWMHRWRLTGSAFK
jgi:predicted transcriptional regulator